MDYRLTQTVPPAAQPVSLTEAKNHLRIDHDHEDPLIEAQLETATGWVEDFTNRQLVTATWRLSLDRWPAGDHIRLPKPPAVAVTSVTFHRSDDTTGTMPADDYDLDNADDFAPARLYLAYSASWPTATLRRYAGVEILYTAGYGDPDDVPGAYKSAIKAVLGSLYEHRETEIVGAVAAQLKWGAEGMLWSKRVWV